MAIFLIGMLVSYLLISINSPDPKLISNEKVIYGKTGLPKNCRAIIKVNIDSYKSEKYTADEILSSIDRNCGEFGYSWKE